MLNIKKYDKTNIILYNGTDVKEVVHMSRLIYVMPWAICDTENLYLKKMEWKTEELPKVQDTVEDWTVQKVVPSPDRRSKDVYIILDVYRGFDFKSRNREVSIVDVTNSVSHLRELGYEPANEADRGFIRQKVLKWDKPMKKTQMVKKKGTGKQRNA